MTETTLGYQILEHWKLHRPTMVESLEKAGRLQQSVVAAQELTGNLLYELTMVRKMDYQAAWEIATKEWGVSSRAKKTSPNCRSIQQRSA